MEEANSITFLSLQTRSDYLDLFGDKNFDSVFSIDGTKHPVIIREHLQNNVSLETLILLEKILGFKKNFDKKLQDPVWEFLSMRMEKYSPFLNIDVFHYKKILKEVVLTQMSFFESDIVQQEMDDIARLQEEIYGMVFKFPSMDKEEKMKHVELLSNLLKKQQVLYTRMSLSDDPEAKSMKENIMRSAQDLGFPPDVDIAYVFNNMTKVLDEMRGSIERS